MSGQSREDYGGWAGAALATYFGGPQYAEAGKKGGEYLAGTTNGSDGKDTSIKDIGVSAGEGYAGGDSGGGSTGLSYGDYAKYGSQLAGALNMSGGDDYGLSGSGGGGMSDTAKKLGGGGSDSEDGSNGTGYMGIASGLANIASKGYDIFGDQEKKKQAKKDRQAQEQDSMRREASYRQDRAYLMSAIEQFYNKRGIPIPQTNFPGQGTSRPLPGDQNPYAGYDVNPSYQTHQPLDAQGKPQQFDPNDPNSTVNSTMAQKPSDAQQALQINSGPNFQQAQIAANQFKPINRAKALKANLSAQAAAGNGTSAEAPEQQMSETPAPATVNVPGASTQTTTQPMPVYVRSIGRRNGF